MLRRILYPPTSITSSKNELAWFMDQDSHATYFTLTSISGPEKYRSFHLHQETMSIGSSRGCYIRLRDKGIRRRHATLTFNGSELRITNLGTKNETRVNGQILKPTQPLLLQDQDEVTIGSSSVQVRTLDLPFNQASVESAIRFLMDHFSKKALKAVFSKMRKEGGWWWVAHHFGLGTCVRNMLTIRGFTWDYFFLDTMWPYLIGEAARRVSLDFRKDRLRNFAHTLVSKFQGLSN